MFQLKVLHNTYHSFRGFWITFLWVFAIGMKCEHDDHGRFVMFSIGIHNILFHFTIALDNIS